MNDDVTGLYHRVADILGATPALIWFKSANPLLGNVSPEWMLATGRYDRLERFISEAETANKPRKELYYDHYLVE